MLIDHTRENVHSDAFHSTPTDLTRTNVALFFTRWVTHFCAPTFVFLAGTSVYLQKMRGKSTAELSKFLLTRGLWLIFLEFTIIRFSLFFNFDYSFFGLAEVIWIFGVSMLVLAALIHLPVRVIAALGIGTIAGTIFSTELQFRQPSQWLERPRRIFFKVCGCFCTSRDSCRSRRM
jgi:uncharacterized membrane protein